MVVRGTKKKELAEAFINFALRPEIQTEFVKRQFNSVATNIRTFLRTCGGSS